MRNFKKQKPKGRPRKPIKTLKQQLTTEIGENKNETLKSNLSQKSSDSEKSQEKEESNLTKDQAVWEK